MEFGECVVLGGNDEILMVDCGSMNNVIKDDGLSFKDYVKNYLVPRYSDINKKCFALTHFHRDHMVGLKHILKEQGNYFDRIYIPQTPVDECGNAWLLEIAVLSFVFLNRKTLSAQMNTAAMFIFDMLRRFADIGAVTTLKRGDTFEVSSEKYKVLNPGEAELFSSKFLSAMSEINDILESNISNKSIRQFMRLKERFCDEYLRCNELCALNSGAEKSEIWESVRKLNEYITSLSQISKGLKNQSVSTEIEQILTDDGLKNEYSNMQNTFSLVFQNEQDGRNNIIMTGDATEATFSAIQSDMFKNYKVFKAPHHGSEGNYCKIFDNIFREHVIISNGDYHSGGKIGKSYCDGAAINHCTNKSVCRYFAENKSCCNRLSYCYDFNKDGAFALKCGGSGTDAGISGCNIYIVSLNKDRGCFCDK